MALKSWKCQVRGGRDAPQSRVPDPEETRRCLLEDRGLPLLSEKGMNPKRTQPAQRFLFGIIAVDPGCSSFSRVGEAVSPE